MSTMRGMRTPLMYSIDLPCQMADKLSLKAFLLSWNSKIASVPYLQLDYKAAFIGAVTIHCIEGYDFVLTASRSAAGMS